MLHKENFVKIEGEFVEIPGDSKKDDIEYILGILSLLSQLVISEIVLEECGAFELKSNFKKETDNNYLEVFDYNQIIYEGKLKKSYLYSILKKNQ